MAPGTVTDTEAVDEDSYYKVEVTLDDGSQVDVQLDDGFEWLAVRPTTPAKTMAGDD